MMNNNDLKQIPYGKSDFAHFQQNNLYYVDKTRYIEIVERKGDTLLFIRPRRFGKSLFLSTLEYYYDTLRKEQFDTLFQGTYIQRHPTTQKNSYMIMKFDFSTVDKDLQKIEESFFSRVKDSVHLFLTRYQQLLAIDFKTFMTELEAKKSASDLLATFMNYLREKVAKVYLIIDEYDNFANTILTSAGQKKYHDITHGEGFYRNFFNVLKGATGGADAPIAKLFISGVSPITLDDLTSGFNIADNISMDLDLNEMLGFTATEVETMINYYRATGSFTHATPELMAIMSTWYNGYRFSEESKQEVFNSTQVFYFIKEYVKTWTLPKDLIDRNLLIDYQKIRELIVIDQKGRQTTNGNFSRLEEIIETGSIESVINKSFPAEALTNPENFISLLFFFGLLTISDVTPTGKVILKIPNETIKRLYYDYIQNTYKTIHAFNPDLYKYSKLMDNMALRGEWKPLLSFLAQQLKDAMGVRDLITGEKAVQVFVNVYLGQSNLFIIHSEKELNKGFADLVLEPYLAQFPSLKYSYVIELKYLNTTVGKNTTAETEVKEKRKEGEKQLRQYALDKKFEKTIGQTTLVKLLLIFRGFELVHMEEVGAISTTRSRNEKKMKDVGAISKIARSRNEKKKDKVKKPLVSHQI